MDLKIKVGAVGLLDMLKFKNQVKTREKMIEAGKADKIPGEFKTNKLAASLHPESQLLKIIDIVEHNENTKTFVFASAEDKPLAYFRAGQYLSFTLETGGSIVTRPVSICSSPREALEGSYAITVKRAGFASDYMLDSWKKGDTVTASAPLGDFYYTSMRDAKHVIALAGGSGITPFLSMAGAIADSTEDFQLTIIYGSRSRDEILFKDVLDTFEKNSGGKIKVVHVLSDESVDGYEHGFITEDIIRKYMKPGNNSYFICGPQMMYRFVAKEMEKIAPERKWVRRELFGASKTPWELPGYPAECKDKEFNVTLMQAGKEYSFKAAANESLLISIERAHIPMLSHCRSGECGWCRSRLVSGNVFIPEDTDGRRMADRLYGYIHPCVSYPTGDLVIEVSSAE